MLVLFFAFAFCQLQCYNKLAFSVSIDGPVSEDMVGFHLNGLNSLNATGTFMVTPNNSNQQVLKRIYASKHTIGIFVQDVSLYKDDVLNSTLQSASQWVFEALGIFPLFVRVPNSVHSPALQEKIQKLGYYVLPATLDYYTPDCAAPVPYNAGNFVRKRNTHSVPVWHIMRFPFSCRGEIYQKTVFYRSYLGQNILPEICMNVDPYRIEAKPLISNSSNTLLPTTIPTKFNESFVSAAQKVKFSLFSLFYVFFFK